MAVMDAQALTTDPDGLAILAEVLGTVRGARDPSRRFPVEAWSPALRPGSRVRFGTIEPVATRVKRMAAPVEW